MAAPSTCPAYSALMTMPGATCTVTCGGSCLALAVPNDSGTRSDRPMGEARGLTAEKTAWQAAATYEQDIALLLVAGTAPTAARAGLMYARFASRHVMSCHALSSCASHAAAAAAAARAAPGSPGSNRCPPPSACTLRCLPCCTTACLLGAQP